MVCFVTPNRCTTSSDRTISLGQANIEYVQSTFLVQNFPAQVSFDNALVFQRPHYMIGVSSILNQFQGTNIYLHFQKLGYNPQRYASITIVPFGDEPWIPLSSAVNGGAVNGRFIRFRFPVKSLFYSADHPNGATPGTGIQVTFWGADDVQDGIFVRRG